MATTQLALNQYVASALDLRKARDDTKYTFLVNQLREQQAARVTTGWIRALSAHATRLSVDTCRELLAAAFRVDWSVDVDLQEAFMKLVCDLSTSHSTYCNQMFRALLVHLNPKRNQAGELDKARMERVTVAISHTLQAICKLVPLAAGQLQPIFAEMYPHPRCDLESQRNWQRVAFDICAFAPRHRESILSLLISRLLQMDVDIKVVGEDDELFQIELGSDKTEFNAESNSELAAKMDALMDGIFAYISKLLDADAQERDATFASLLAIFSRAILTTAKSKYTQFLLFQAASKDPRYLEQFAELLFSKATCEDHSVALATRITAASYLASLLARASYVGPETLTRHLAAVVKWANNYSRSVAAGLKPGSVITATEHTLFYAMVQAAMYVVCYAHSRAAPQGKGLQWLSFLGFAELIQGPLCPMRVCNDAVVTEFVSVGARMGEPRLDAFRRVTVASLVLPPSPPELSFPFDPYLLRHSSRHIEDLYVSWSETEEEEGAPAAGDGEADEDEEDSSGEEDATKTAAAKPGSSRRLPAGLRSPVAFGRGQSVCGSGSAGSTPGGMMDTSSWSRPIPRRDSTASFGPMSIPDEGGNFHLVPD